jgi:hypothetical protein
MKHLFLLLAVFCLLTHSPARAVIRSRAVPSNTNWDLACEKDSDCELVRTGCCSYTTVNHAAVRTTPAFDSKEFNGFDKCADQKCAPKPKVLCKENQCVIK